MLLDVLSKWRRGTGVMMLGAVALSFTLVDVAAAKTVLRVAVTRDLQVLDPTYGGGDPTHDFGYATYDMLFSFDDDNVVRPQMVDTYTKSDDGLVWTFKLRPGLAFHSGRAVTSKDVLASIKRWGAKIITGQTFTKFLDSMEAPDDQTFVVKLKAPYSLLLESFATEAGGTLFIIPEELASTDPGKMIDKVDGSGPFKFDASRFVPGSSWVLVKNEAYVARSEPPSGTAGGKLANVDELEYRYFGDSATAVNALIAGEVDVLNDVPYELLPLLEKTPDINLLTVRPLGNQVLLRPNFLYPPFDNEKMRQALFYLLDPHELLIAGAGEEKYVTDCVSAFICGPGQPEPLKVKQPDIEKAKQLIKDAGYDGKKIVFLNATDQTEIARISTVVTERMRAAGLNVDLEDMDWGTMTTRRANKSDPATSETGWNLFTSARPGMAALNPTMNSLLATQCDGKNWFGWPCDPDMEKLRAKYLGAETPEAKRAVENEINERFKDTLPYITIGKTQRPTVAARSNVKGFRIAHRLALWNVIKE